MFYNLRARSDINWTVKLKGQVAGLLFCIFKTYKTRQCAKNDN